ncbi:unnamed protein product [Clonostachys rosea]|uniref:Glucose-methanol-choline oxidoreductase N-terminal domain-containing protein n=1 Tax=Bionectria ochroleuca TaxID=29856 RepID=A0ABY6U5B5_BIOOC|nr:unnamed protein product [Clonostachys rosea]
MGLYTELPVGIDEVDVIVVGGGTAGCIIAARLADADPNLAVLVIEGGQDNYNMPEVVFPGLFLSNILPGSKTALFYKGNKSPSTANRDLFVPSGGVLGGGSSINFLTYSRGQRADFDSWNTPGWSAEEILPYLKKFETYHGPGSEDVHGYSGPVNVSRGGFNVVKLEDDFIGSAQKLGWPETKDLQGLSTTNAVQRTMRYISPDGKRQDTAHRYLHPRLQDGLHLNLHVLVETQVERVILENKRAVGVVYKRNPAFLTNTDSGTNPSRLIKAKKMVVISSGGCGSPAVLERSGIGGSEVLKRANVPLVVNVPGVGQDFKDHVGILYAYKSGLGATETMDKFLRSLSDPADLIKKNDPMLAWNSMDVTSKLRPSDADVAALGPVFQKHWDTIYKDIPEKPVSIITLINGFPGDPTGVPQGQYMGISMFSTYPRSVGHVHITGPQVDDALDFETGYLTDREAIDVKEAR